MENYYVEDEHDYVIAVSLLSTLEQEVKNARSRIGEGLSIFQGSNEQILHAQVKVMNGVIAEMRTQIDAYKNRPRGRGGEIHESGAKK